MSQIEEINEQIVTRIDKNDEFYLALWGNEVFTPTDPIVNINDFNCGAICNALEYLYAFVTEITNDDFDTISDPCLDIIVFFFVALRRFGGESDADLVKRMQSILVREADWRSERMGTGWDLLNVFSYYVSRELLYYIPNHVLTNLIINGGFESAIGAEWTFVPSGDRSAGDSLTGAYKVDFTGITSLAQTVAVTNTNPYIFHCFYRPKTAPSGETDVFNLEIQRSSDNYYYNIATMSWSASAPTNTFSTASADYILAEFFILNTGSYNITIKFLPLIDFFLDKVELGEKLYPAFEILYIDFGGAQGFASMWDLAQTPYDLASFHDQDYMFASATSAYSDEYFQALLNTLAPSGVRGVFNREVRT